QRNADKLLDSTRKSPSTHVSDLHDDGQHEGPPARTFAEKAAQLDAQLFFDEPLIGPLLNARLFDDVAQEACALGEEHLTVFHHKAAGDDVGHALEGASLFVDGHHWHHEAIL